MRQQFAAQQFGWQESDLLTVSDGDGWMLFGLLCFGE